MHVVKVIRIVVILAVLGTAGYFGITWLLDQDARKIDPNVIRTSGVVEAVEVRVGSKIAGPLAEVLVEEGDTVAAGQVVARVDIVDYSLRLAGAEAAVKQARSLYQDSQKGLRPEEIAQIESAVAAKQALYERAKIEYDRTRALAETGVAPIHQAELARKAMEAARMDMEASQDMVRIAKLGSRADRVRAAAHALEQAEAAVAEIRQKLADGEITAPSAGRVSIKNMETGEIVGAGGTIITLVDLDRPWVRVYVPESKLGRIRLGMAATILSDSFKGKEYVGTIRYISSEAEFTPKNVQTEEERVKLVYAIKIYVDNPNQELKPGMPVDAVIRLGQ
jgi:HlyD family secretion protein